MVESTLEARGNTALAVFPLPLICVPRKILLKILLYEVVVHLHFGSFLIVIVRFWPRSALVSAVWRGVATIHVDDVQLASPPSVQDAPVPLLEHVDMASTVYA